MSTSENPLLQIEKTKEPKNKIIQGLQDAISFEKGDESKGKINLLLKSSLEVKRPRGKSETVNIEEIEEILFQFKDEIYWGNIYSKIGLSPRAYKDDKERGQARKVTKYALLGLLSEQQSKNQHNFTYNELAILFSAITHHIPTRAPPYRQETKDLQIVIGNMMMEKE
jgi:hypothetical protein